MNIIDFKVNINKLDELVEKGYQKKLTDMCFLMSKETKDCIESFFKSQPDISVIFRDENKTVNSYYKGILLNKLNSLPFGYVQLGGMEDKSCTRITLYADGSTMKEENITDRVFVIID